MSHTGAHHMSVYNVSVYDQSKANSKQAPKANIAYTLAVSKTGTGAVVSVVLHVSSRANQNWRRRLRDCYDCYGRFLVMCRLLWRRRCGSSGSCGTRGWRQPARGDGDERVRRGPMAADWEAA